MTGLGTFRSPTGPGGKLETFDECRQREEAEAAMAARQRSMQRAQREEQQSVEMKFARLKADVVKACTDMSRHAGQRFGEERDRLRSEIAKERDELRNEMAQSQYDRSSFIKEARATIQRIRADIDAELSERRSAMVAQKRQIEALKDEIEELRQALDERRPRIVK